MRKRMRYIGILIVCLISNFSFGQNEVKYTISGAVFNVAGDSIKLSKFTGRNYQDLNVAYLDDKGEFELKGTVPVADYYVMRVGNQALSVVLKEDEEIEIYGDGKNLMEHNNLIGSEWSDKMNGFSNEVSAWTRLRDSAMREMKAHPDKKDEINSEISSKYYTFQSKLKRYIKSYQNTPALIVALSAVDPNSDFATYESIVKQLNNSFGESPTVQQVSAQYKRLKKQKEAESFLAPGKEAPDFEELMLDRKTTMKLSDLRGKVVLLDFWASWCGPCRKENPNVVSVYNKYKEKGFTVMSVSLDGNLDRWKKAIEQDGLAWPNHVSDLKKWSSAAAKKYGVRGIPFAVLIDKEGKIVATNLRGNALETKVAELLD